MKIFYGVQGTGNGHLSRARELNRYFKTRGADVQFAFSGRQQKDFTDMEEFGTAIYHRGLTFKTKTGKIDKINTIFSNNIFSFLNEVRKLDLSPYDVIVSDFDPVTAWAAKLQKRQCLGIGHQVTFKHPVPVKKTDFAFRQVISGFSPTDMSISLGFNWKDYGFPIAPPIFMTEHQILNIDKNLIIVYFPFEEKCDILNFLESAPSKYKFICYGDYQNSIDGNVEFKKTSFVSFAADMLRSSGVISNAGFVLTSEAIHYGKKLLVKPLQGQAEQHNNAAMLVDMCYAAELDSKKLNTEFNRLQFLRWLQYDKQRVTKYPPVARYVADWIMSGDINEESRRDLCNHLWNLTKF